MDPVYTYLSHLAIDEDRAELGRLLYVGLHARAETAAPDRGARCQDPMTKDVSRGRFRPRQRRSRACGRL